MSDAYFSAENVQIIQNGIRAGVNKKSKGKYIIKEQDVDTIKIIMRSMFLQHAVNSPDKVKEQIERLNKLVLDYAVPKVYGEALGYIHYKKDASMIHEPLNPPVMSRVNDKQLQEKSWI